VDEEQRFPPPRVDVGPGGRGAPSLAAAAGALAVGAGTVVLVEGISDQFALEALAQRRGRDLGAEGISIVPMGGATNVRGFLKLLGPQGYDLRLAGLCDAGEEGTPTGTIRSWRSGTSCRIATETSNMGRRTPRCEERLRTRFCCPGTRSWSEMKEDCRAS
jgi:hypothetical protein